MNELLRKMAEMSMDTPEGRRYNTARNMFEFLVQRNAWFGVHDWDSLDPQIKIAFIDMVSLYGERTP